MKKYLMILGFLVFSTAIYAQKTQFSVVGGLQNAAVQGDVIVPGFNTGNTYYIGFGSEFSFSSKLSLYSELTYSNIKGTNYFQLPILLKYQFSEKSSFLLGPQIGHITEKDALFVDSFSVGISAGYRYDFSEKFYGIVRYTYQLNDHYSGPLDISNRVDMASIGFGFKF